MNPTKNDLVIGAYQLLRISGLTSIANNKEVVFALSAMDDWAAQLSTRYETGYLQPTEYGLSDPNDLSGISIKIAGPFKKMLAVQLATAFGKEVPPTLAAIARSAERDMEMFLVEVAGAQNPATLPIGSGNEWGYRSNKFYLEPNNDDGAVNKYENEIFNLNLSWVSFVGSDELASVTYENDSGINISSPSIDVDGSTSVATLSFNSRGQFQLCATATSSTGLVETRRFVYNAVECIRSGAIFP